MRTKHITKGRYLTIIWVLIVLPLTPCDNTHDHILFLFTTVFSDFLVVTIFCHSGNMIFLQVKYLLICVLFTHPVIFYDCFILIILEVIFKYLMGLKGLSWFLCRIVAQINRHKIRFLHIEIKEYRKVNGTY